MTASDIEGVDDNLKEFLQHIDRAIDSLEKMEIDPEAGPNQHHLAQRTYEALYRIRQDFQGNRR